MRSRSLRLRLAAGGIVAIVAALSIAGVGLTILFKRHVTHTIADDLEVHLTQLLAGLNVDPAGRLVITRPPTDPRFAEPLSGLYWQVSAADGQRLRSRSLWDAVLAISDDALPAGALRHHEVPGPAGTRLLAAERNVSLTIGGRRVPVRAEAAVDLARISAASAAFAKELAVALALLGLVLAAATSLQVVLGLRPLDTLRRGIAGIRSGASRRLSPAAPAEVQPLVEELNALLEAQEREIERSRRRAADLAHGLKTPLAALMADAGRLREQGEHAIACDIEAVGEAMNRHVDRELARIRVRGSAHRALGTTSELTPLVRSLIATLTRTPKGMQVAFEQRFAAGAIMPFDRSDLAEVLGNLLENAVRHAASRVRISFCPGTPGPLLAIEDDGQGIAGAGSAGSPQGSLRLDQRREGAGLGLLIVRDVLDAYGWTLELSRSDLGGLKAVIRPSLGLSGLRSQTPELQEKGFQRLAFGGARGGAPPIVPA